MIDLDQAILDTTGNNHPRGHRRAFRIPIKSTSGIRARLRTGATQLLDIELCDVSVRGMAFRSVEGCSLIFEEGMNVDVHLAYQEQLLTLVGIICSVRKDRNGVDFVFDATRTDRGGERCLSKWCAELQRLWLRERLAGSDMYHLSPSESH